MINDRVLTFTFLRRMRKKYFSNIGVLYSKYRIAVMFWILFNGKIKPIVTKLREYYYYST